VRTPLVLVILVGGLASADSVRDRIAALAARDVVVTGHAIDASTGAPFVGVTVIAASKALPQPQTTITDEQGWYSIEAPSALTQLTFYYGDLTIEHEVYLPPSKRVAFNLAFEDPPERAVTPPCAGEFAARPRRTDVDALVAAVLRQDNQTKMVRWSEVLERVPEPFRIVNEGQLQAIADRTDKWQVAVSFESIEVAGSCAVVKWGHGHTAPRNGEQFCLCGDSYEDVYERRRGVWRYVKTVHGMAG